MGQGLLLHLQRRPTGLGGWLCEGPAYPPLSGLTAATRAALGGPRPAAAVSRGAADGGHGL